MTRTQKTATRNQRILDALGRLKDEHFFVNASLKTIAREAGFSKNNTKTVISSLNDLQTSGHLTWIKGTTVRDALRVQGRGTVPTPSTILLTPAVVDHDAIRRANNRKRLQPGAIQEDYTEAEIVERDDAICQLCMAPIDLDLKWPHRQSLSLDHIWPLELGGNDRRENVWCSHLSCNSRRGVTTSVIRRDPGSRWSRHHAITNVDGDGHVREVVSS